MQYARFIVNPAAGAGKTARKWQQIMALLKGIGLRFEHQLTEAPAWFSVLPSVLNIIV